MIVGFRNPFPVRIPCPVYPSGEPLNALSANFFSRTISVSFAKHEEGGLPRWCYNARTIELNWYPAIRTTQEIIAFYVNEEQLTSRERGRLRRISKPQMCGKGTLIDIYPDMMRDVTGHAKIGGSHPIFLLSHKGQHGTLRVNDSAYNHFDLASFEIGSQRDWTGYPKLTNKTRKIKPIGQWVLWLDAPGKRSWPKHQEALESVMGYSSEDAAALLSNCPCYYPTGTRSTLLIIQKQLRARRIVSEVLWSDGFDPDLPWFVWQGS